MADQNPSDERPALPKGFAYADEEARKKICPVMSRAEIVVTEARPVGKIDLGVNLHGAIGAPQATPIFAPVLCQGAACALWNPALATCSLNLLAGERSAR